MSKMSWRRAAHPVMALAIALVVAAAAEAWAQGPVVLRYSFKPDCLRRAPGAPCDTPKGSRRLDLGPQIAVWIEKGDGSYVDTLMVTSATSVRGIGNRPGYWRFPSNWHFPYGKRPMALPVWAHTRGRTYQTLIIQDDDGSNEKELWLGFHEVVSSPDPYYCLTFRPATWIFESVDSITCPTGRFNSAKGRFDPNQPKSYYPPRSDLTTFAPQDCDIIAQNNCPGVSAMRFGEINDLDAVAAATPPYGDDTFFKGVWNVPADLPEGPYVLAVEVNKEFDGNASHMYEAFQDPQLPENGLRNNFGQPSVVWKVPFALDRGKSQQTAATDIAGYGDWDGKTGTLHAPDSTISDSPGSGQGRLAIFERPALAGGPAVRGRVHVVTEVPLKPEDCVNLPPDNGRVTGLVVPPETITDRDARVQFLQAADRGQAVQRYDIRFRVGDTMTAETFLGSPPAMMVTPGDPGTLASLTLTELKGNLTYTVGVRADGGCVKDGPLETATFTTKAPAFKQLSGCFVATAAYGSALEPRVATLRRLRDRARAGSAMAAVPLELYERASPPVASVLRESEAGRALVRSALSPLVSLVDDAMSLLNAAPPAPAGARDQAQQEK